MALATKTQADTNSLLVWLQSASAETLQRPPRGATQWFQFRYTLATTELDNADDRTRLLYCPTGIWVLGGSVYVEDEIDAHATPTLVWDLITETAAGAADTRKLISAATAGQSAAQGVALDAGAIGAYIGERYIVFDPTTAAATAAEGDIILTLQLARGLAAATLPSLTLDAV